MLPDVIDEFMIKTGERNESIFYSFYVFFNKLSVGVAVGLSTLVLEYGKFLIQFFIFIKRFS
jgi:Na+/melibiose symporter-like transporter